MASRSLNKVTLIGNLTRDPELRYTPQGTAVCSFGLATNRYWTTENGEKREETEFHRIVAWTKLAELCSQLLVKGRKVYVEGRLQTRSWTDASGAARTTTEVVIDDMIILDSKRAFEESQMAKEAASGPAASAVEAQPKAPVPATQEPEPAAPIVSASDDKRKKKKKEKSEEEEKEAESKEEINLDDIPF